MASGRTIADRLRQARKRAGLSQRSLGIAAGIDPSSASPRVNSYEQGKHTPAPVILEQIGKALNVPAPYFYATEDDLAEAILFFGLLSRAEKKKVLAVLRRISSATNKES